LAEFSATSSAAAAFSASCSSRFSRSPRSSACAP
jgi:hypothetical protein